MENESADGHVIVAFGKVEGEHFVHLLYFESCREYVFTAVGFLCHVVVAVVFVFDVAENFFYNIFKGDETAGASKLVDDDGQGAFLLKEDVHEFLGGHGLGYERKGADVFFPLCGVVKHFRRMDISHHMVDIVFENHNL